MRKFINIKDINVKGSPHVRGEYRLDVAEEYAERYREKKHGMPDPVLFKVGKELFVGDGMHRIKGMELANATTQTFEVMDGTWEECVSFALCSNVANGIRRSDEDKRACAELSIREFPTLSDVALAEKCLVGKTLIGEVRKMLEASKEIPKVTQRVGRDGRTTSTPKPKGSNDSADTMEKPEVVSGHGKDATGFPLTEKSLVYWNRGAEVEELLKHLKAIERGLMVAKKEKDIMFVECNFNAFEADFDRVITNLELALPYAVCAKCQGQLVDKCRLCGGRGIISKHKFDTGVPAEMKKLRKDSIK